MSRKRIDADERPQQRSIMLLPRQYEHILSRLRRGASVSDYIRRLIDRDIERLERLKAKRGGGKPSPRGKPRRRKQRDSQE